MSKPDDVIDFTELNLGDGEAFIVDHQELTDAIALAMQTARTEALLDAEKVVRDLADAPRRWATEVALLKVAANRIAALPRREGQTFERLTANFLRFRLNDSRIDIRPKNGTNDRGDIGGVRTIRGADVVLEVKNHARMELSAWLAEAEEERGNADASAGVVVHKRKGRGAPADQYVTMTLATFAWLLEGGPDDEPVVVPDPHTVMAA